MKTFLEYVAKDLLCKQGEDLTRVAVVFPNKRASLFLDQALIAEVDHSIFSPAYITISELFRAHSSLQVPEQMELVFQLYDVYRELVDPQKSLDSFYGWGQQMLADFDDLDKNLADATKLFVNVEALQELSTTDFLTDHQRECLEEFFGKVASNSQLQKNFKSVWSKLLEIYNTYQQQLRDHGQAYEGMLYRDVVERHDIEFNYDTYVFVGFNLLQKVEQRLFRILKDQGKAVFYWDYDESYLHQDAGKYIHQLLELFPNELSADRICPELKEENIYNQGALPKQMTYLSATTETSQASYVRYWLSENGRKEAGRHTAIVLADESLLQSVIQNLPKDIGPANITTGYPLTASPVSAFVDELIQLQVQGHKGQGKRFRLKQVLRVLHNPLARLLSQDSMVLLKDLRDNLTYYPTRERLTAGYDEGLSLLFSSYDNDPNWDLLTWMTDVLKRVGIGSHQIAKDEADQNRTQTPTTEALLTQECVFKMFTLVNRLNKLIHVEVNDGGLSNGNLNADGRRQVSMEVMLRLMKQLVQATTVPFHGEPAVGVQIMGVLETRNLDFDHVLLLSCNEGNLPKGINDLSLIPHSIRKEYGLTTVENKVGIYSYYFNSLLQRASDITITYNNATDDGQKGEMSRFMLQMLVQRGCIARMTLQTGNKVDHIQRHPKVKDEEVVRRLGEIEYLSPSAINRYLRCPMMFYFSSILQLKEPDDNDEDSIDQRTFGDIFHAAAQYIYQDLSQDFTHTITQEMLGELIKNPSRLDRYVGRAFNEVVFKVKQGPDQYVPEYNGLQLIDSKVVKKYLIYLLRVDEKLAPLDIVSLEQGYYDKLTITFLVKPYTLTVGGKVDRLDKVNIGGHEMLRVIDYKTGTSLTKYPADVEEIFNPANVDDKHSVYYLQTFLYSTIVNNEQLTGHLKPARTPLPVSPALFFVRQASNPNYNPMLNFKELPAGDLASGTTKKAVDKPITDISEYQNAFTTRLQQLLEEIFNPEIPFGLTIDTNRCNNCPYRQICD